MRKLETNFENAYITLSQKPVVSFNPPAFGILQRNIFTGGYRIVGGNKIVPLSFEQGENLIEINF